MCVLQVFYIYCIWWKHYIMVGYCASFYDSAISDIRLLAWIQRWQYLHPVNKQILPIQRMNEGRKDVKDIAQPLSCKMAAVALAIMPTFHMGGRGKRNGKKGQHQPWLSLSRGSKKLLQNSLPMSHCPEPCHMTIYSCQGGWEGKYFDFPAFNVKEEDKGEAIGDVCWVFPPTASALFNH